MAKISVIIPVYNVEKYICECIDSVINQTYKDIEIIIIDDGSKDASGELLDCYAREDARIRVVHKVNGGVSAARNDGLKLCNGEYIYVMDSDDYLELDAIEHLYSNALETQADVIIADHLTFIGNDKKLECHFFNKEFVTNDKNIIKKLQEMILYPSYSPYPTKKNKGLGLGAPWTKLIKRSVIFENNLFFESYVKGIFDDGLFALYVLQYAETISYTRQTIYNYRILQSSLMRGFNPDRIKINNKVFEKIESFALEFRTDNEFMSAYKARVILYLRYVFSTYLFNENYHYNWRVNCKEFLKVMRSQPYKKALQSADKSMLRRSDKNIVILSRLHMMPIIWFHYRFRHEYNKKHND